MPEREKAYIICPILRITLLFVLVWLRSSWSFVCLWARWWCKGHTRGGSSLWRRCGTRRAFHMSPSKGNHLLWLTFISTKSFPLASHETHPICVCLHCSLESNSQMSMAIKAICCICVCVWICEHHQKLDKALILQTPKKCTYNPFLCFFTLHCSFLPSVHLFVLSEFIDSNDIISALNQLLWTGVDCVWSYNISLSVTYRARQPLFSAVVRFNSVKILPRLLFREQTSGKCSHLAFRAVA